MSETASASQVVREDLRKALNRCRLDAINFLALSMRRSDGIAPEEGQEFPLDIQLAAQLTDEGGAAYQVKVAVERPDISVSATVGLLYVTTEPELFRKEGVTHAFGELVALPAAYPYLRAKLHEISTDSGVEPILLGILDMTRISLRASEDE